MSISAESWKKNHIIHFAMLQTQINQKRSSGWGQSNTPIGEGFGRCGSPRQVMVHDLDEKKPMGYSSWGQTRSTTKDGTSLSALQGWSRTDPLMKVSSQVREQTPAQHTVMVKYILYGIYRSYFACNQWNEYAYQGHTYELDLTSHASRSDKPWGISFSGTVSSFVSSGLATEFFFDFFDLLGFSLESDTFPSLPSWSFSVFFLLLGFSVCFSSLFFFSICTLPPFFLVSTVLVAFVPLGLPRLPGAVFLVPFALASSSLCASLCSLSGSSFSRFSFSSISPEPKVLAHCRASLWAYGEKQKWNLRSINHGLFTNYSAISAFMRSSSFFASAAIAIESLSASLSREAFTVGTGANSSFRCFSWLASSIFYERRKKRWE